MNRIQGTSSVGIEEIEALVDQSLHEESKSARIEKRAAHESRMAELHAAADDLRDQATDVMVAGIVQGGLTAVGGACNIAGAVQGTSAAMKVWDGGGDGAKGLGVAGGALFNKFAGDAGERSKRHEAAAEAAKARFDDADDTDKEARRMRDSVQSAAESIERARNEAALAAIRA